MDNKDTMLRFAERYLGDFKVKPKQDGGEEIVPEYCPFCHGGDNSDKETFALSIDKGVYVCKRGSCGKRGHFDELAEFFGDADTARQVRPVSYAKQKTKAWKLPETHLNPPTEEIYSYFEKRCISRETVDAFKVQSDDNGMIVFPFYENGVNVFEKFRRPWKPRPEEKGKEWRAPGTKAVLFGMDMCSFAQPLVITEGQIDAMSLYEAGVTNAVSVPSGCEDLSWIENCWDWLEKFKRIILFGDNDDPGRKMVQQVAKRLDESRCSIVEDYPYWEERKKECKDANEVLYALGPFELVEMVENARQVPIKGLLDLGTITPYDPTTVPRIKTMIPALDATIGGLAEGSITIFTGDAGCGKLLADDTVVMTRKRWKTHGSLVVGDEVVGRNGEFVKVQYVFPKYYANMEVILSNGEKFKCHENHEWVVEFHPSSGYKEQIKTAKELYDMLQDRFLCVPQIIKGPAPQKGPQQPDTVIRDIHYCDPVPGNCIQVEGGIYCVGRTLTPTHNSTLTGLLLLNAIEQGHNVCAYSGELPKEQFQEWVNLQAAGSDYIGLKWDQISGKNVPFLSWQIQQRLSEYYGGKFFLFDNNEIFEHNQAESILEVFTMAVRRYGCKLFLVDNLMTSLSDVDEETRAQGKFIGALKKFANRFSVHVLVVAHPRKRKTGEMFGKSDVAGNSQIVNLADSAIVVEKPNLRIIKNRRGGIEKLIECCYCGDSRRIYQADKGDLNNFSWNKEGVQKPDQRADSLPEYGVMLAQTMPF